MRRGGFTLVEMLVVILILLVLAAMTLTAVNFTLSGERTRAASRQVQSYLEGARSRAIYQRRPIGVRFLLDQIENAEGRIATCSSMVYVGENARFETQGKFGPFCLLERENRDGDQNADSEPVQYVRLQRNIGQTFYELAQKQLIVSGYTRITIWQDQVDKDSNGPGRTFTVFTTYPDGTPCLRPDNQLLRLSQPFKVHQSSIEAPFPNVYGISGGRYQVFKLHLPYTAMPNEEPVLLPQDIVIDLDHSSLPFHWKSGSTYSGKMDIMFSPRGTVIGPPAAKGIVHFLITDRADTDIGLPADAYAWDSSVAYTKGTWVKPSNPNGFCYRALDDMGGGVAEPAEWPTQPGATIPIGGVDFIGYPRSDKLIVSLFTQTGNISAHHVFEAPGGQPDPFRYAETGKVAGN